MNLIEAENLKKKIIGEKSFKTKDLRCKNLDNILKTRFEYLELILTSLVNNNIVLERFDILFDLSNKDEWKFLDYATDKDENFRKEIDKRIDEILNERNSIKNKNEKKSINNKNETKSKVKGDRIMKKNNQKTAEQVEEKFEIPDYESVLISEEEYDAMIGVFGQAITISEKEFVDLIKANMSLLNHRDFWFDFAKKGEFVAKYLPLGLSNNNGHLVEMLRANPKTIKFMDKKYAYAPSTDVKEAEKHLRAVSRDIENLKKVPNNIFEDPAFQIYVQTEAWEKYVENFYKNNKNMDAKEFSNLLEEKQKEFMMLLFPKRVQNNKMKNKHTAEICATCVNIEVQF